MINDLPLLGNVALVAGATRGAGRQIAIALGEKGATVWCSGRSVRGKTPEGRPETIEETAELVTAAGGVGRWAQCDHTDPAAVEGLLAKIEAEDGKLNILINDIWGGDSLTNWGPFEEHDLSNGLRIMQLGVSTHLITARIMLPLLLKSEASLLVEITDGVGDHYRGTLFYDLAKASTRRLAFALNSEIAPKGHTAVAVTPGFLRSEAMLDLFGVTEENWHDGAKMDPHFQASETPRFVGRGIASLAADLDRKELGGRVLSSGWLGERFGCTDVDGRRPNFSQYAIDTLASAIAAIPASERPAAFETAEALSGKVGSAAAFVGVGGAELLEELRKGGDVRAAVQSTLKI